MVAENRQVRVQEIMTGTRVLFFLLLFCSFLENTETQVDPFYTELIGV